MYVCMYVYIYICIHFFRIPTMGWMTMNHTIFWRWHCIFTGMNRFCFVVAKPQRSVRIWWCLSWSHGRITILALGHWSLVPKVQKKPKVETQKPCRSTGRNTEGFLWTDWEATQQGSLVENGRLWHWKIRHLETSPKQCWPDLCSALDNSDGALYQCIFGNNLSCAFFFRVRNPLVTKFPLTEMICT